MRITPISRSILHIALPAIASNVTVPLLGMVDTAIVGHIGQPSYIGAISVGALTFSIVYWLFGFLRASTSGLTAQAYGARNLTAVRQHLRQSILCALVISSVLLTLQQVIFRSAIWIIHPSDEVAHWSEVYYNIAIWGAPAVLLLTTLNGWMIGLQDTRKTMFVAILQNLCNIPLSLYFVFGLKLGVAGVALGTICSQYLGLATALYLQRQLMRKISSQLMETPDTSPFSISHKLPSLRQFIAINRDIFLRTVCIVTVTVCFTSVGARQGDTTLAANTILLHLFYLFSYVMDGFANAGETLSGHHYGARDSKLLHATVRKIFGWGIILSLLFFFLYLLAGRKILSLFSNDPLIIQLAGHYIGWSICIPLISMAAFIWDGILIGLTQTRAMLLTLIIATGIYFALLHFAGQFCSDTNQSLWLAFTTYLFTRSFIQTIIWPKVCRQTGISYSKA